MDAATRLREKEAAEDDSEDVTVESDSDSD